MYALAKADTFVKQARTNGSVSSVIEAAEGYITQKERERAERTAAYRAWRVEEATYTSPPSPKPAPSATSQQAGQTEPLDSAARSYTAWAKAVEAGKFDSAAYARTQEGASVSLLPGTNRPPIGGIIVAGVLLTLATVILEIPLTWGEVILAGPAFAGNPLAVAGELLLMSASAFLLNFEIAYWVYAYRVVFAPVGEDVKLNMTPFDWGLSK